MADTIETLKGLDDAALRAKLGQDKALDKFKTDLARIDKITDAKARKYAEGRLTDLLNPTIYAGEIGYIADSAERKAKKEDCGDVLEGVCDCAPD